MSKRGLPTGVTMRHDAHYVEEFARTPNRSVGKIIPIGQIVPNPHQPRVEIGELGDLADSIKQKGVLEPPRPRSADALTSLIISSGDISIAFFSDLYPPCS